MRAGGCRELAAGANGTFWRNRLIEITEELEAEADTIDRNEGRLRRMNNWTARRAADWCARSLMNSVRYGLSHVARLIVVGCSGTLATIGVGHGSSPHVDGCMDSGEALAKRGDRHEVRRLGRGACGLRAQYFQKLG